MNQGVLTSPGFTSSLYEFVSNCQELSLVPLKELANNALRRALETIFRLFDNTKGAKSPLHLPTRQCFSYGTGLGQA
jgi:hypothetical protein